MKYSLVSAATLLALSVTSGSAMSSNLAPNLTKKDKDNNGTERVIIKFKQGKHDQAKKFAEGKGGKYKRHMKKHRSFSMEMPKVAMQGLRNNPNIEFIEPDAKRYLMSTNLNTTEVSPWGIERVQADVVSDNQTGNRKVCIIDSGYDIRHGDLSSNAVGGTNDSGTGQWSTPGGSHGTHVAGTIAGVNNGSGVVGVTPNGNINIHVIKVFNEEGWAYSSSLIAAVDECVDAGSNVISMSLGGSSSSTAERQAFQSYLDQGILSIAAAGNDGNTAHSYPASYDAVVSVAAVDSGNKHANFSQSTNQVELAGPGEAILSSVGLGDGQLAQLTVGGVDYFDKGVVPHTFYNSSLSFDRTGNDGSASGTLGVCTTTGTTYSCGDMTGKICLVERAENQADNTSSTENNYPEYRAADACANAGAEGIIVYSNADRPGLQAPFLVDFNGKSQGIPTASVDRATGLELAAKAGQSASLSKSGNQDWEYYNGTSMATPHVSAVAALVWSYHETCTASEIRSALAATAMDLDATGRDNNTGYGMVQAQDAISYLNTNGCEGGTVTPPTGATELTNGQAETSLAAGTDEVLEFTMAVPSGSSNLSFDMSGGTGDADLYVKFGSAPTTSSYDCRPYKTGNTESCDFASPQSGTYYVSIIGYSAFSGVSLTGSFDDNSSTPNQGPTASFTFNCTDLSCSFNASGSSDSDGSISAYAWSFGDSATASSMSPSHTYSQGGDFTVTLTVTDNDGATDSVSQTVSVTEPVAGNIQLTVDGYRSWGRRYVDLSWDGANGNSVDIYRYYNGGTASGTTANDGAFTDRVYSNGTYYYQICEAGTNNCSDQVAVSF
jgi:serine protease